jgi:uncharacterized membrane protein
VSPAARQRRTWTDERIELLIGNLLRAGVVLSAVIVLASGAFYLWRFGGSTPDYSAFRGEPAGLRSVSGIVKGLGALDCRAFIQFGVLVLIATPVARVALSVFGFGAEGDRTYVAVSLIVLGILIFSLSGYGVP